jgi:hypothetical protein
MKSSILILALGYLGIFATQVVHADGTGGYYFRYLLPALLPISLFLAFGLLEFKWTRGMLVWLFATLMGVCTIYQSGIRSVAVSALPSPADNALLPGLSNLKLSFSELGKDVINNGVSQTVGWILAALFIIGVLLLGLGLFNLTREDTETAAL